MFCCIFLNLYLIVQKIMMHFTVDDISYWKEVFCQDRILGGRNRFAVGKRTGRKVIGLAFYM